LTMPLSAMDDESLELHQGFSVKIGALVDLN
jgi:hypothetical protein